MLSHAHIDHCGYLPKLVKEGFRGKIYCTSPTAEISKIALMDSGHIQETDAAYKKKRHRKEGRQGPHPEIPLYTREDAQKVPPHFRSIRYKEEFRLAEDIHFTYYDAGHILGSAMIELRVTEDGKDKIFVFSGDIGRWDRPILRDPHLFQRADYVIMEATYGNRQHEVHEVSLQKLIDAVLFAQQNGGCVLIPAFAIERTQEILYYLNQLMREKKIPALTTFVDSPMAVEVSRVFEGASRFFDDEAKELVAKYKSLFYAPTLKMAKTTEESKAINNVKGSSIILAGSGMCTGGRIKHHLVQHISRPESVVLFSGYQAYGTLGRQILEKPKEVRLFGKMHPVRAKIEAVEGFSGHADRDELLRWISSIQENLRKIFVVHSEEDVSKIFADTLRTRLKKEVAVPKYKEEFIL